MVKHSVEWGSSQACVEKARYSFEHGVCFSLCAENLVLTKKVVPQEGHERRGSVAVIHRKVVARL